MTSPPFEEVFFFYETLPLFLRNAPLFHDTESRGSKHPHCGRASGDFRIFFFLSLPTFSVGHNPELGMLP